MTDVELISSYGTIASVCISLWSLSVAKRAEKRQREDGIITDARERRSSIAVHLQKYSDLLTEVRACSKPAKFAIAKSADDAFKRLSNLVDEFADFEAPRQSRHLFHEMSEQVCDSFESELGYQYVEHLLMRYAGVRRRLREMRDACAQPSDNDETMPEIARLLVRFVRRPAVRSGYTPEQRALSSKEFLETYKNLSARLDRETGRKLLLAAIEPIEEVCEVQRQFRPILESCDERLVEALDRNAAEEYKVQESQELWAKIQWEMRALGLLGRLNLGDITYLREHDVAEALPEIIHAGAVLYTLTMVANTSAYSSKPIG